jgi:hypothetical protein
VIRNLAGGLIAEWPVMEWSGRALAPPAYNAGTGLNGAPRQLGGIPNAGSPCPAYPFALLQRVRFEAASLVAVRPLWSSALGALRILRESPAGSRRPTPGIADRRTSGTARKALQRAGHKPHHWQPGLSTGLDSFPRHTRDAVPAFRPVPHRSAKRIQAFWAQATGWLHLPCEHDLSDKADLSPSRSPSSSL